MKKTLSLLLLFATPAFAHLEPGTWSGTAADGTVCSFVAGDQYFENDTHHPLNERIPVTVNGVKFIVGHPPVVDAAQSIAFFNHDLFQGVLPTPTGSQALVIEMVHEEGKEGPRAFHLISHAWKTGTRSKVECSNLKRQAK